MNEEDKELLLKELCARLPYDVKVDITFNKEHGSSDRLRICSEGLLTLNTDLVGLYVEDEIYLKPYLRPMSSMTEEEREEFSKLLVKRYCEEDWEGHISTSYCIEIDNVYTDDEDGIKYPSAFSMDAIDWLNKHHFDYRGLIEKCLALEAPKGMYK